MAKQDGNSTAKSLMKKLLMPLVATTVSAAATYAGKRAPQLIEQKVMPRLRSAGSGTEDLVSGLADRAKSTVGSLSGDGGQSASGSARRNLSADDLEQRRREREEHRSGRRNVSRSSTS